jgi:hypothetical protein
VSQQSIWPILVSAFTGGLAGSALSWLRDDLRLRANKGARLNALRRELRHALWLVEYNRQRAKDTRLVSRGLASLPTGNSEEILFDPIGALPLSEKNLAGLHDLLQQTVYHNSLVAEYSLLITLPPPSGSTARDRAAECLTEIAAVCTSDDTYRKTDSEPSLHMRIRALLRDLPDHLPRTWH